MHKKSRWGTVAAYDRRRCASIGIEPIPLLASRQGVAASLIKFGEATEADAAGVVFLLVSIGKPPRPRWQADVSRHFLDRSASPPCGDARRGIALIDRRYSWTPKIVHSSYGVLLPIALVNSAIVTLRASAG